MQFLLPTDSNRWTCPRGLAMKLDLRNYDDRQLDAALQHFEEHGYFLIEGMEEVVAVHFRKLFAELIGVKVSELDRIFAPDNPELVFPQEVRQRVSKIQTPRWLGLELIAALKPILYRLIGPFAHVSSTFHGQFKGGAPQEVGYGGYSADYMEVHRPYQLHQDFTGASLPTSPSHVTLWTSLNTCPYWNLRLYPGSHKQGLLCHQFLALDDPRLEALGPPLDIQARVGTGAIFNALLLHGTSNPGPMRRVSTDLRFFPLCGYLPSEVHALNGHSPAALEEGLARAAGPVLRSPLLEARAYLGGEVRQADVPPLSVLNWVNYLSHVVRGEREQALPFLERFVNTDIGCDTPEVYRAKFHGRKLDEARLQQLRQALLS